LRKRFECAVQPERWQELRIDVNIEETAKRG